MSRASFLVSDAIAAPKDRVRPSALHRFM